MARFRLKCGAIVQVDDADGHLLRSRVYRVDNTGKVISGHSTNSSLKQDIVGRDKPYIVHRDGDSLNCRRGNLLPLSKEEYAAWVSANTRARHLLGEMGKKKRQRGAPEAA
jgi:hypothetical protein